MTIPRSPENEGFLRDLVNAGIAEADRGELIPAEEVFAEMDEYAAEIERRARSS